MLRFEKVKSVAKIIENKERKEKEESPVSLSSQNGAGAPEDVTIRPEVMRKFNLQYNTENWPPKRRDD